jgi:transcriptional regulator with XRE-family HTH domain
MAMTFLEIREKIGQNAKALRIQRGMTQQELSGRAGLREGTISRFERTGTASMETVIRIGSEAGEQTLIISLKDFAMMFQGAARPLSFGDVLDFVGFKPVEHTLEFDERRRNREALLLDDDGRSHV